MKNRGVKKLKKKVKFKLIVFITLVFFLPLLFISCISLFMLKASTTDPVEVMKVFDIPYAFLIMIYDEVEEHNKRCDDEENEDEHLKKVDFLDVLTYAVSESDLDKERLNKKTLEIAMERAQERIKMTAFEKYLYNIYSQYLEDVKIGPVARGVIEEDPEGNKENKEYFGYTSFDDFGAARSYGGNRKHLGNDLMTEKGTPLVSITDGVVTQMGWNDYGGWRIGITTRKGTYFYYAHLEKYEEGIEEGSVVKAGDVIGYVGDSGYGPVGTVGKFAPHLHLQIGIKLDIFKMGIKLGKEKDYIWVNPYNVVKFLDRNRIMLKKIVTGGKERLEPIFREDQD